MRALRLFAIILIFAAVTLAWMLLGLSIWHRTGTQDESASKEIESLWGPKVLAQAAPYWARPGAGRTDPGSVAPAVSSVTAHIRHEYRYKGLLWYSLFSVDFSGTYTVPPAGGKGGEVAGELVFSAPAGINLLDGLIVSVDAKPVDIPQDQKATGTLIVPLDRTAEHVVTVAFTTYGQEAWLYFPGKASPVPKPTGRSDDEPAGRANGAMSELGNFSLTVTTNFAEIDYPKGSRSPRDKAAGVPGGMRAVWQYANSLTRQPMGVAMPDRIDPGPIVRRMSFFAPVSLFFFFTTLFTVVVLKKIPLHPMHYLFISAGFFAFHILLAYLVDHVNVHGAFWICAAVSVVLVVSYMRLVAGAKFALSYVAAAQLIYLIGFSYAFFWKGYTGLTVVVGAILTLFLLMQSTGRVKWHDGFERAAAPEMPPPPPVQP